MSGKRKLISFLGAPERKYSEFSYSFNGKQSQVGPYVQAAIMELLEWTSDDELIICLSESARIKSWLPYEYSTGELNVGLQSVLQQRFPDVKLKEIDHLSDAHSDRDLWAIFDKLTDYVDDGDELIIDITNSFRYVPVWGLNIIDFLRTMKKIDSVRIFYGNVHKKLNPSTVQLEDLSYMFYLMDWSNGIQSFLQTGSTVLIDQLMKRLKTVYLGNDESLKKLHKVTEKLQQFSMAVQMCRSLAIGPMVIELRRVIAVARDFLQNNPTELLSLLKPFIRLLTPIEAMLDRFRGNLVDDQLELAHWCFEKGLYQQSYTILEETVTTMSTLIAFRNESWLANEEYRLYAERSMVHVCENKAEEEWNVRSENATELEKQVLLRQAFANLLPVKHLLDLNQIQAVGNDRNDINHAGYRLSPAKFDTLKDNLEKHLSYCKHLITELQAYFHSTQSKRAFIILSHKLNDQQMKELQRQHHVSESIYLPDELQQRWSEIDPTGPFPIKTVKLIDAWLAKLAHSHDVFIVQGEMAAVYSLVLNMQKRGFQPLYATTERIVLNEEADGDAVHLVKTFQHVQFRPYPNYWDLIQQKKQNKSKKQGD